MALLYYSQDDDEAGWKTVLQAEMPELDLRIWPETGPLEEIDAALVWLPPPGLLASLPNLKAIFSLGAGVDSMLRDPTLPDVPLCRMIDPSLTRGMAEFVLAHVLWYHRDLDRYAAQQRRAEWKLHLPVPADRRRVGIMGLGELGAATARLLASHGFAVRGWSRTKREIEGVETFAGADGLGPFLARSEFLVCLLPLTDDTRRILRADLFAALPRDAVLIHVGRGEQLDVDDVLAAVRSGRLRGAMLDVMPTEPLPEDSPLWREPGIVITPHAASYVDPRSGGLNVAENLRRLERGEPLIGLVDRRRGY